MHTPSLTRFLASAILIQTSIAGYALIDDFSKDTFFGNFTPFSQEDPTHGFVTYNSYAAADSKNLIKTVPNANFASYLTADPTSTTNAGRDSMRIASKKSYNHGLFLVDLLHIPSPVCGSWPAFWLLGAGTWPAGGEIDVIEGVNMQERNQMTLHTSANCALDSSAGFTGTSNKTDCGPDKENTGCAITAKDSSSFGAGFNQGNGGVYATEWTSSGISIYFFPRANIPADIQSSTPDPSKWGQPLAKFAGKGCDWDAHFKDMNIVFNTAFCGDWAGKDSVWESGGCAAKTGKKTCQEFVASSGASYKDSFWLVNYVRVFQQQQQQQQSQGQGQGQGQGGGQYASTTTMHVTRTTVVPAPTANAQQQQATPSQQQASQPQKPAQPQQQQQSPQSPQGAQNQHQSGPQQEAAMAQGEVDKEQTKAAGSRRARRGSWEAVRALVRRDVDVEEDVGDGGDGGQGQVDDRDEKGERGERGEKGEKMTEEEGNGEGGGGGRGD
ncbi:uncharacterized protein KY384_005717 [Bacidia gigantensis]|uniref:uncharacterized protein n=1 Tax=Bacidia gigantensis TaxID=2732470 RepID=UPI001D04A0F2|nr:uncharacterized protein KY384_005717 [Bacidia gigantensis]KAG8529082.1 hypothetical protein KY384_005717 [Bacidia gigantensis]